MEKEILSRKMLYDLVWSVPMLTLSKKYAISDVGLRKICLRMNIPLPKPGHWQKLQFGKKIKKVNLDADYQVEQQISLELRTDETKASSYKPSVEKELQLRIEEELNSLLLVPEKLTHPHALIVAARESLNRRDRWVNNGLVNPERGILDIKVASGNIVRSLRFMDTLIKALRGRGHSIEIWNDKTKVLIDGQKIEIQLREKLRKEIEKGKYYDSTIYVPKGLLSFQINSYPNKEWIDGNVPIEKLLSKILARLETIAQEYKVRELESKRRQEIRDAEEKIRKDYEQRKAQDLKDFKEMLLKASRWHKATNLRNYIDAVEAKVIADNGLNDESQKWLTRARQKADWYDPFIEVQDELLEEIDRETLEPIKKTYSFNWQP